MKLIMRSEFDNLRLNPNHTVSSDQNGDKQIVKVYFAELLICKRVIYKKSTRYFGIKGYDQYLIKE